MLSFDEQGVQKGLSVELELAGPPVADYLLVFVKDPEVENRYWPRTIGASCEQGVAYLTMPDEPKSFVTNPGDIRVSIRRNRDDGASKLDNTMVGLVEYHKGNNGVSLEDVFELVGLTYCCLRTAYFN